MKDLRRNIIISLGSYLCLGTMENVVGDLSSISSIDNGSDSFVKISLPKDGSGESLNGLLGEIMTINNHVGPSSGRSKNTISPLSTLQKQQKEEKEYLVEVFNRVNRYEQEVDCILLEAVGNRIPNSNEICTCSHETALDLTCTVKDACSGSTNNICAYSTTVNMDLNSDVLVEYCSQFSFGVADTCVTLQLNSAGDRIESCDATYAGRTCDCNVCNDQSSITVDCSDYDCHARTNGCQKIDLSAAELVTVVPDFQPNDWDCRESATVAAGGAQEIGLILDSGITIDPTVGPTTKPMSEPTAVPTSASLTRVPSESPVTPSPTSHSTTAPTMGPTTTPTAEPTTKPTALPTVGPTIRPTTSPSFDPTSAPSSAPTSGPTLLPTSQPTTAPTMGPTMTPTYEPSARPTAGPTITPTVGPTVGPTFTPTSGPTAVPTSANPTRAPSDSPVTPLPTSQPTATPTVEPITTQTAELTALPTVGPTIIPTVSPSFRPTAGPSSAPTSRSTFSPTSHPTTVPTMGPTMTPTYESTARPTAGPIATPIVDLTAGPTFTSTTSGPTVVPTNVNPTRAPCDSPITPSPTSQPSTDPTLGPTTKPTAEPTASPTVGPNIIPTAIHLVEYCLQFPFGSTYTCATLELNSAGDRIESCGATYAYGGQECTCQVCDGGNGIELDCTEYDENAWIPCQTIVVPHYGGSVDGSNERIKHLTPTQITSLQPLAEPSSIPTSSSAPSNLPSDLPSLSPSMYPTVRTVPPVTPAAIPIISIAPSNLPSLVSSTVPTSSPTVSMAPTPFFAAELRQTIVLTFDELQREMTNNVTAILELTTEEFLQRNLPVVPGGSVTLSSVRVLFQFVVPTVAPTPSPKEQKGGNRQLQASGLEVLLEVKGLYESWVPVGQFDFKNYIFRTFEDNWDLYKNVLFESSQFFTPLVAESIRNKPSPVTEDEAEIGSIGLYIAVCLFILVSALIGLFVLWYVFWHYRDLKSCDEKHFEKEHRKELDLERPVCSYLTSLSMELASEKNVPIPGQPIPKGGNMQVVTAENQNIDTLQSAACVATCTTPTHMSPTNNSNSTLSAVSLNKMEIGQCMIKGRNSKKGCSAPSSVGGLSSSIMYQIGGFSSNVSQQDPPDCNRSSHYKGEPSGQRVRQLGLTTQNMDDYRETTVSNTLQGCNMFELSRDSSVVGVKSPCDDRGSEISQDPIPTSQDGGWLGATDIHKEIFDPSTPHSSTNSSSLNACLNMAGGLIETRPVASPKRQMQSRKQNQPQRQPQNQPRHQTNEYSYQQLETSMGGDGELYDVFAPSGALGIVVDTTKDGPVVRSLKQNSPLLGLINPGDLIIGLDDEYTQNMTADTLTRLIARKSPQHERKITLLIADNY